MSQLISNKIQIGQSATANQNFTLAVPTTPNGTVKLSRGNIGATTQDILSVDSTGNLSANTLSANIIASTVTVAGRELGGISNAAFNTANTAVNNAASASLYANTAISNASSGSSFANLAYAQANTAVLNAASASTYANTGVTLAQAAFNAQNSTAAVANTKFSSSGGTITGSVTINTDLNVGGNVYITGNTVTVDSSNMNIADPLIYMAQGNATNLNDIGLIGHFTSDHYQHTGIVRDHTDGVWKFFSNVSTEPSTTVNFSEANTVYDSVKVGGLTSTSVLNLPARTTANRPASPIVGSIGYNTTTGKFEGYSSGWGNLGGGAAISDTPPNNPGSGDLWWNSSDGNTYVYYNGQWVQGTSGGEGLYLPLTGGTISGNITYTGTLTGSSNTINIGSGQIYKDASGNVAIGSTSPSAKLHVIGTAILGSGSAAGLGVTGPTWSGVSFGFDGVSNLGQIAAINPSTSQLAFYTKPDSSTAPIERMRIDYNGLVGIGTSSPTNPLTVTSDSSAQVRIGTVSANINARLTLAASGTGLNVIGGSGVAPLAFFNGSTEQMRLDTSGNVGIGTSSPGAATGYITLDVNNATNGARIRCLVNGTPYGGMYTNGAIDFRIGSLAAVPLNIITGSNTIATFDTSGNFGLGVTPSAWGGKTAIQIGTTASLSGISGGEAVALGSNGYYSTNWKYIASGNTATLYQQDTGAHKWYTAPSGTAGAAISWTQAMTLDASGNLGIGTTGPSGRVHITSPGITAAPPSLGWPNQQAETDTNAKRIYIDTAGNGSISTANSGATVAVVLGQYYDSRAVITTLGAGGASPTDQGVGSGRDLMLKGGTSDNGDGKIGGRLYLSGGVGYSTALGFNTNYGNVILQPFGGSVGVGTNSPSAKFHVLQSTSNPAGAFAAPSGTTQNNIVTVNNTTNNSYLSVTGIGTSSVVSSWNDGSMVIEGVPYSTGNTIIDSYTGSLVLQTSRTDRLRIDSSGHILFNKTSVSDTTGSGFLVYGSSLGTVTATMNNASAQNTYHLYNINATNNGYRFYVGIDGGIRNYSANNTNLSDARVKKDIKPASSWLSKINAIEVVNFKYKDQSHDDFNLGVIAQQVETVAPELVDIDGFGETPADGIPLKTIYETDLKYAMLKAIQEQQVLIEQLNARIAILENK